MIITLVGRRIDAQDAATPRFPLERCARVYKHLLTLLSEQRATILVSSAACGADLLALEAAGQLGIQRHIILPFASTHFRAVSVTDRPGEWGSLFDQIISEVEAAGNLVLLHETTEDTTAFLHTNQVILNEALILAARDRAMAQSVLAVLVWDGQSRGADDLTADFAKQARLKGIPIVEIGTQ